MKENINTHWQVLNMKSLTASILAFIMAAVICTPVFAQDSSGAEDPGPPPGKMMKNGKGPQMNCEMREKLRKRAETMVIWRVSDKLGLSDDQESQFEETMQKHNDERDKLLEEERALTEELKADISDKSDADKKELKAKLDRLEELKDRQREEEKALQDELKEILSVEQQAELIKALPEARREVMQQIKEFKQQKGGKGKGKGKGYMNDGMGQGGPPDDLWDDESTSE